jgi:hypothetical protein
LTDSKEEEEKEQQDDTALAFSSESSQFADYTTWKGIENRTGIEREHPRNSVIMDTLMMTIAMVKRDAKSHAV